MSVDVKLQADFKDACEAGDYAQIIRLATEKGLIDTLSDMTNIDVRTMRGFYHNKTMTPSKNQIRKITTAAATLAV